MNIITRVCKKCKVICFCDPVMENEEIIIVEVICKKCGGYMDTNRKRRSKK